MNWNSLEVDTWHLSFDWSRPQVLFTALVLAVLFSVQFPLPGVDSQYVSINLSDLVILVIFLTFIAERAVADDWVLSFPLAHMTGLYVVVSTWLVVVLAVAVVREPVSVVPSALWTLKWLEILMVLVLAQQYREEIDWRSLTLVLVGAALVIALDTIVHTATTSGWEQPTTFWRNPNTLGVFLGLPSLLCLIYGSIRVRQNPWLGIAALLCGIVFVLGVGATGSRSGMITLVIGLATAVLLARRWLSTGFLVGSAGGSILAVFGGLWITGRITLFRKFFPTVTFRDGTVVLSGPGTGGLYARYEMLLEAVHLWLQQPIFGYGWLASPENPRVGYLDVLYSQLLVDVGLIGLVLVLLLYLSFVRAFVSRRELCSPTFSVAGAGWIIGMLAAGIGGAHVRVPRIMFLMVLLLAAAAHLTDHESDDHTFP